MLERIRGANLKQRFVAATALFVVVAFCLGGYALHVSREQNKSLDWARRVIVAHESLHSSNDALANARRGERTYLLYGDETGLTQYNDSMNEFRTDFSTALTILRADLPSTLGMLDQLNASVASWVSGDADKGIALRQNWTGSAADLQTATFALAQDTSVQALFTDVSNRVGAALIAVRASLAQRVGHIQDQNRSLTWIVLVTLLLMLVFSGATATFLYRGIVRPIDRLSVAAIAIADGDFSRRTGIEKQDEIGRAAQAFDFMAGRVEQLVERLESTQADLFDRESRLTTILSSVGDAILIVAPDSMIVQANAAAEVLFDKSGVSLEGMSVYRFIHRLPDMNVGGVFRELEHGPRKRDVTAFKMTGERFQVESTSNRARINGAWHVVLCLRDISDRVGTEEALRRGFLAAEQARRLTRSVIDAANDVMLFVSLQQEVVLVNRRHSELFGVADDEVLNRSLDKIAPVYRRVLADPAQFLDNIRRPFGSDETVRSTITTQQWPAHRDLNLMTLQVRGGDGAVIGTLCVIRDISAEREADQLKSDFVSLVSHELRTPLTSIKGYVDLLLEGEVGPLNAEQSDFLSIVATSSTRLVSLTNDLLDVSRIEAGRLDLHQSPMDVAANVRSVLAALHPQIDAKQQRLTMELEENLPPILADQNRFAQILTNLVSNANKYTEPGGSITVRVRLEEDLVRFEVADTGAGLTTEEQSRLFTRFYRVRNKVTQQTSGTGLGLAISKSLVEAQGGAIGVTSVPGEGSTFFFTLPAMHVPVPAPAVDNRADRQTQSLEPLAAAGPDESLHARLPSGNRILIVEDENDIALLLQRYLQRAGYETTIAANGAEALDSAITYAPDLITLDVALPDIDGFSVLERLREDSRTSSIPVIFISILPSPERRWTTGAPGLSPERRKTLGAVDYLAKPVDERLLIDRIRLILNGMADPLILVADDDEPTRSLLRRKLERAGYRVIEAKDGLEALAAAEREPVALALIDVRMPNLNGIETLQRLRLRTDTARLPVVMMTASPNIQDAQMLAIERLGATLLRGKNLSAQEIAEVISSRILPLDEPSRSALAAAGSKSEENQT